MHLTGDHASTPFSPLPFEGPEQGVHTVTCMLKNKMFPQHTVRTSVCFSVRPSALRPMVTDDTGVGTWLRGLALGIHSSSLVSLLWSTQIPALILYFHNTPFVKVDPQITFGDPNPGSAPNRNPNVNPGDRVNTLGPSRFSVWSGSTSSLSEWFSSCSGWTAFRLGCIGLRTQYPPTQIFSTLHVQDGKDF